MHHGNFKASFTPIGYNAIWPTTSILRTVPLSRAANCRTSLISREASFHERAFNRAQATSGKPVLSRCNSQQRREIWFWQWLLLSECLQYWQKFVQNYPYNWGWWPERFCCNMYSVGTTRCSLNTNQYWIRGYENYDKSMVPIRHRPVRWGIHKVIDRTEQALHSGVVGKCCY